MADVQRFPIAFDTVYGAFSRAMLLPPSSAWVEVGPDTVTAKMGWAFSSTFSRQSVVRTSVLEQRVHLTRGVHGWLGRWLVNGAGEKVVSIALAEGERARVMGFPVKLRELMVSVADPAALQAALKPPK